MPELIDADMIRDAVDVAARHLMTEGVVTAMADDGNQQRQLVQETQAIGLAGVWTSLALFMALIALAGFLRRNPDATIYGTLIQNCIHKMKSCLLSAYQTLSKFILSFFFWTKLMFLFYLIIFKFVKFALLSNVYEEIKVAPGANKEHVKKEIKTAIEDFRSVKERLKLMQSQRTNKKDVGDIKAAIKTVRSIEEYLKLVKSENINEEVKKQIQDALEPAIVAVQAMEEIINKGVWLL